MVEVGNKLLGKFADCLAESSAPVGRRAPAAPQPRRRRVRPSRRRAPRRHPPPAAAAPGEQSAAAAKDIAAGDLVAPGPQATSAPPPLRRVPAGDDDAVDLLDAAGVPVLKRLLPVVGVAAAAHRVWRLLVRPRG